MAVNLRVSPWKASETYLDVNRENKEERREEEYVVESRQEKRKEVNLRESLKKGASNCG